MEEGITAVTRVNFFEFVLQFNAFLDQRFERSWDETNPRVIDRDAQLWDLSVPTVSGETLKLTMMLGYMDTKSISATF